LVLSRVEKRGEPVKVIQVGTISVAVSVESFKKKGSSYSGFRADLRHLGLKRPFSSSLESLEAKVKELVGPLVGENETLTLRHGALRAYERAKLIADEMGLELDEALLQLRKIQRLTASKKCPVEQAMDYWGRHHDQSKFNTPVHKVAHAFLTDLKANGNTKVDVQGVKGKVNRFAQAFACSLNEIAAEQYRVYFSSVPGGPRSRKNHRAEVRRFINWAKDNGYLPYDHPGIPRFAGRVKVKRKRVDVYNALQREQLIAQAQPVERPITLIKAYVPTRAKEAGYSCWDDLDWEVRILMVWGDIAKTGEPRPIHLPRELCERLRPLAQPRGRIYPFESIYKIDPRLARKAGLKWIRNGWRKTVISHLQAGVDNKDRVAEEAGTSVAKPKSNYLKPLRPDAGRGYFGLKKGELHPIEPGYNAAHYGASPAETGVTPSDAENVITVQFSARQA
jgi:integrase